MLQPIVYPLIAAVPGPANAPPLLPAAIPSLPDPQPTSADSQPLQPLPPLLGLPDAYAISSTGGALPPIPASPVARWPIVGPVFSWIAPLAETVSDWTSRLLRPVVQWTNRWSIQPVPTEPPRPPTGWQQAPMPDWRVGGTIISQVAQAYGYRRGQPVCDPKVIQAMLAKAGQLYGVPGEYLARVAQLESSGQHYDSSDRVKAAAAVGIMQIEKSAYPGLMAGGPANAVHNAYDIGNNMAIGAMQLRQYLDRQVRESGYRGSDPWRDIGPLIDLAYNAGSGALAKAQQVARQRGLDPYNWEHLLVGRSLHIGLWGRLDVTPQDIANSPMTEAVRYYHNLFAARGRPRSYPFGWTSRPMVRAFDFDGNGTATKTELLLARTLYLITGKRHRA